MLLSCYLIGADTLLVECGNLILEKGHSIRGVISNAPRVKEWALERRLAHIPLGAGYAEIMRQEPFDFLFAITHLAILPDEVLSLPRRGAINFHDGPLPRYAGLNTPAWALMNREERYGVSWHFMTAGVDEGALLKQRLFDVSPRESSLTLNARNFEVAIETFEELLGELAEGKEEAAAQDGTGRSYFGRHTRPACAALLDWSKSAVELDALVRGLDFGRYDNPLGLAKVLVRDRAFGVAQAEPVSDADWSALGGSAAPGSVVAVDGDVWVATGNGGLAISKLLDLSGAELAGSAAQVLGVQVGDQLRAAEPQLLEAVRQYETPLSKAEAFWEERLASTEPAELVVAHAHKASEAAASGGSSDLRTFDVPYPAEWGARFGERSIAGALAALGLYLGRTSGKREFGVAFRGAEQAALCRSLGGLAAPFVPFKLAWEPELPFAELVARASKELALVASKGGYLKDLVARKPRLRERSQLVHGAHAPVAIRIDAGEAGDVSLPVGVSVEFRLGSSGVQLRARDYEVGDAGSLLTRQIAALFDNIVKEPSELGTPCGRLPLISSEERQSLLVDWNGTAAALPDNVCVHQLFEAQVLATPDRDAVLFQGERISYAALNARANALAAALRERGVGSDQLVGVMVKRSIDLLVATLGVLKAGGAYLPLDPAYPAERVAYMLEDSGARWVVTEEAFLASLPAATQGILVGPSSAPPQSKNVESGTRPEHLAYVIYTSGSTGRPKGVMVEHRNAVNFFVGMDPVIHRGEQKVWLAVTSLSFDISVLELFWTLSRGFTVVVHRDDDKAHQSDEAEGTTQLSPGKPIDFSLFLWGADDQVSENKYEIMLHAGRFGDAQGFSAVWTPERHFHAFGGPYPNPAVTGAALAAITSKVQIRGGSCVVPLHHPVRVAEEWSVVDNLSRGRVGISFASGWQPDDFLLQPQNFKENKRVMVESIDQVRRLWRGEKLSFKNGLGQDVAVLTQPRPIQKELPYWVTTAGNPDTFRAAGEIGANLLTHLLGQTVEELAIKVRAYREARAKAGLDPKTGIVSLMLHTYLGEDEAGVRQRVREPMKHYLRSSVSLIKGFAWAFPAFKKPAKGGGEEIDLGVLTPEDMDTILDFAFERYYETSGLFGTVDSCLAMIERVRSIDVDDIACLIDFGVPTEQVKEGLVHLGRLKARVDAELRAQPQSNGAAVPASDAQDHSLAALARRHSVSHLQCTPSLMRMALLDPETKSALFGIPHLMVGGEAMPLSLAQELASRPRGDLTNMYGPTETTVWSATHRFAPNPDSVLLGRPIANTQLYVLDTERQPLPVGVPGELYIGGHGVVRGYHQRPELSAERFSENPFVSGGRMYRTGDLVRFRADGSLEFLGRTDHQVKIRGHRIELGEIETLLTSHEEVDEGVVVAREDTPGDQRLVAYYTGRASVEALRERLRAGLPDFMVPAAFVCLPRMPHTPNGKIDRKLLPAPEREQRSVEKVAPASDVESTVLGLWQQVLGLDAVGVNDNFFDLGGHSLLVVRLHQMLKKALNPAIPMTALYRFPTIRGFVQSLGEGDRSEAAEQARDRGQARREQMSRMRGARARK